MDILQVGRHIGVNKECGENYIISSLLPLIMSGGNAAQIFIGAPKNYYTKKISKKIGKEVIDFCVKQNMYLVVHGAYIYNFCNSRLNEKQISGLATELKEANRIGADVIIHQGKNVNKLSIEKAMKIFVDGVSATMDKVFDKTNNCIILENSSRQGTDIGYSVSQLYEIYILFDEKYKPRIKFCIDLCHAFVSGKMDVRSSDAVTKFFNRFDRKIGKEKLAVIHFNDSATKFARKNDHHDNLMDGYIGNKKRGGCPDGFKRVVKIAKEWKIPLICETPLNTSVAGEISLIRSMID